MDKTMSLYCNVAPALSKKFSDVQVTIELGFTLKRVRSMRTTNNHMHRADKYSQHSSVISPVWLNGSLFVYKLSCCEFERVPLQSLMMIIIKKKKRKIINFHNSDRKRS